MNFKVCIFLIVLGISSACHSDTLHIYLNTNTCKSCNLVGKQFEYYKDLKKILYLHKNDFRIKEEILESLNFDLGSYEVRKLDNTITYPNNRSFWIFQRGTFKSDSFLLGDSEKLQQYILPGSGQSSLSLKVPAKKIRALKLDKRVTLSDEVIPSVDGRNLLFFDAKLNKAVVAALRNDSIIHRESFNASKFSIDELKKCKCFDEKLYNNLGPVLSQLNLTQPTIDAAFLKDDLLTVMIGLDVGVISATSADTVIAKRLFIYSLNFSTKISRLNCVSSDGNFETDQVLGKKFSVLNLPFIKNGDTLYTPIVSSDSTKKSLFVKQVLLNKTVKNLGITKDLGAIVPPDFKFTFGTKGVFLSRGMNYSDYYFIKAPLVYHIDSKKYYFVNNSRLISRLKADDTYISDCQIQNGKAKFLLKEGDVWYIEEYSINDHNLLSAKVFETSRDTNILLFIKDTDSYFIGSSPLGEWSIYD